MRVTERCHDASRTARWAASACSSPAPAWPASPPRAISCCDGADVTVVDARDRVGGRVWTIRDGFAEGQHAEAGGDLIDEGQHEIRKLAEELGLKLTRILRGGFGYARPDASGKTRIVTRSAGARLGAAGQDARRRSPGPIARRAAVGLADRRRPRPPLGGAVARRDQGRRGAARDGDSACAGSSSPIPRSCR